MMMIDHEERSAATTEIVSTITVEDPWSGRRQNIYGGDSTITVVLLRSELELGQISNKVDIRPSTRSMLCM